MKIVVTGGSGFVGKYIVNHLRLEGYEVTPIDIAAKKEGLKVDVTVKEQVKAALTNLNPEVMIHLAALAGARGKGGGAESLKNPYGYFSTNVNGTLNVFETCREMGIAKVLCMSSFSPYGVAKCPIDEDTPLQPNNPYGASKACMEEIAKCYSVNYGIKVVIFRPPLVCGEGQKEMNVLREFVISALCDKPIVILGEGRHVREFLHPIDIAKAYSAGVDYLFKMERPYDVFVLGNKPVTMIELAQNVINRVGKGSIEFRSATKQVFDQFTDHSKAMRILGWAPKIYINEIVERVISDIISINIAGR